MNTRIDKTPVSPIVGVSKGHVAYLDIGPVPVCIPCETIEECPTCPVDQAYKEPVVAGDLVYFQFRFEDQFNLNPVIPQYGWLSNPSEDWWLEATIETSDGQTINLPGDIVRSQSVGWANGSYQNLVIDSGELFQLTQGCWRVKIETYRNISDEFFVVLDIGNEFPNPPIPQGSYAVVGDTLYIYNFGEWASVQQIEVGDWVQLTKNGLFYQFDGENWVEGIMPRGKVLFETCFTSWHKFVTCEQTVLIEGTFGFQDCRGYFYGITEEQQAQGLLPYRDKWRILGSFEFQAITSERTETENGVLLTLIQNEEWLLRNHPGLPEKVARRLANSLNAVRTFVNSNEYFRASDIRKINEAGKYWYVSVTLQRLLCEKKSGCEDDFVFNPIIECPGIPVGGGSAIVRNSDNSFVQTVSCGGVYTLPDTTYRVFLDGNLEDTFTTPSVTDYTINLNW